MSKNVTKYVSFFIVAETITELESIYMMQPVATCSGGTVYHVLDREEDATEAVYNCWHCYDSAELLLGDYPELDGTETVETEDGPVEVPILKPHSWC